MFRLLLYKFLFVFLLIPWLTFAGSPLEDELVNDPLGRGYSSLTNEGILNSLNAANRSRNVTAFNGRKVAEQAVGTEYATLTAAKKSQFLALISSESQYPVDLAATVIEDIFGNSSVTLNNLNAAKVETISRKEELELGNVKIGHIEDARP